MLELHELVMFKLPVECKWRECQHKGLYASDYFIPSLKACVNETDLRISFFQFPNVHAWLEQKEIIGCLTSKSWQSAESWERDLHITDFIHLRKKSRVGCQSIKTFNQMLRYSGQLPDIWWEKPPKLRSFESIKLRDFKLNKNILQRFFYQIIFFIYLFVYLLAMKAPIVWILSIYLLYFYIIEHKSSTVFIFKFLI